MADFEKAYKRTLKNEGGYSLIKVPGDKGGETYAGISKVYHPTWEGWRYINSDFSNDKIHALVYSFYREEFWNKIKGNYFLNQSVAESLYDFAVNVGYSRAVKLTQIVVGTKRDGIIGPVTIKAINDKKPGVFNTRFTLLKILFYANLVERDKRQRKFFYGWVNRALKMMRPEE